MKYTEEEVKNIIKNVFKHYDLSHDSYTNDVDFAERVTENDKTWRDYDEFEEMKIESFINL